MYLEYYDIKIIREKIEDYKLQELLQEFNHKFLNIYKKIQDENIPVFTDKESAHIINEINELETLYGKVKSIFQKVIKDL